MGAWVCSSSQGVLPTGKRWSALGSRIAGNQGDAVPHCAGGWLRGWQVEARGRRLRHPQQTTVVWMAETGKMEK